MFGLRNRTTTKENNTMPTTDHRPALRALPHGYDDKQSPHWIRPEDREYYSTVPLPSFQRIDEYAYWSLKERMRAATLQFEKDEADATRQGKFLSPAQLDAALENMKRQGPSSEDRELAMHRAILEAAVTQRKADEQAAENARKAAEKAERLRLARICPACHAEDVDVYSVTSPLVLATREEPRACTDCAPSVLGQIEEQLRHLTDRSTAPNGRTRRECAQNYVSELIGAGAIRPQHPAIARDENLAASLTSQLRLIRRPRLNR